MKRFLTGSLETKDALFNCCYALFRFYAGISITLGAGWPKLFHKINEKGGEEWSNIAFGPGQWFVDQVGDIGFSFISPSFWAYLAVYGEFLGGLLIALGIFTRLSAIQLAFQFFVVSFIWYQEPFPLLGMYYQQLIFWSFVLTFAGGDGKYSLAHLINHFKQDNSKAKPVVLAATLLVWGTSAHAQPNAQRVSFVVNNPSFKNRSIDFKSYDQDSKITAGYGYSLNGFAKHATNMPVPTYVFEEKNGKKELLFVVTAADNGKTFSVTEKYSIAPEQYLAAEKGERRLIEAEKTKEDRSIQGIANQRGIQLVAVSIKGSSLFPTTVHVRYELPWGSEKQIGFTQSLGKFKSHEDQLPVGTKIYQCSDKFWDSKVKFTEKLVGTIDANNKEIIITLD